MTDRRTIARLLAVLVALAVPSIAVAALQPPSIGVDTAFAPPDGVARDDLAGALTDIPSAVAVDGGRIYTVGEARDTNSNSDVSIVAHRVNGSLDTGFSEDGKLVLPIASDTGKDVAWSLTVLPDGRLRVLIQTDTVAGGATNLDVGILGLNADGSIDALFGGGDGIVTFPVGAQADTPTRMVRGADGRFAIAGYTTDAGSKENAFVALREEDGSPVATFGTNGVRQFDRGGPTLNDRAVDVVFRPGGGLLAALQVETNPENTVNDFQAALHAFDDTGADDPRFSDDGDLVLAVGEPDTIPGGMLVHRDRVLVTGSTRTAGDTDGFLVRMNADGSAVESRRFDVRGTSIQPDQAVTTAGSDMTIVAGPPETLVVTGSINFGSRPYWAGAAFNDLDKPLAEMGYGDMIIPTEEYGAVVGVAAGGADWVALAGSLVNTSQNFDTSFGTARVLIDAEKTCDLAISVPRPLEVQIAPGTTSPVQVKVTNVGSRPCSGSVSASEGYTLSRAGTVGAFAVGPLDPGAVSEVDVDLGYAGAPTTEGTVTFTVDSPADKVTANNAARLHVLFDYCDLQLRPVSSLALMPSEGARHLEFTVSNAGTRDCRRVRLGVARGARVVGAVSPYTLRRGRSASDTIAVRLPSGAKPGATAGPIEVRAAADGVANASDDLVRFSSRVVGVGDSAIRAMSRRAVSGRASGGSIGSAKFDRRRLRVGRVAVAVGRRVGKRCRWQTRAGAERARSCSSPLWISARGTTRWSLELRRPLRRGTYVVLSRAVIRAGFPEASFTSRDGNRRTLRVR